MTSKLEAQAVRWDDVVQAVDSQVSTRLGDEVAILELDQGIYFGLNPTGATVWDLLGQPVPVKELHARLLAEYEVDAGTAQRDLLELLGRLRDAGLIRICQR